MTVPASRTKTPIRAAPKVSTLSSWEQKRLWDMEEKFWTSGAANARATTAYDAIMVFPYPPGILQGDQIWNHLGKRTGWRSVVMAERRVMRFGEIAILTDLRPDFPPAFGRIRRLISGLKRPGFPVSISLQIPAA